MLAPQMFTPHPGPSHSFKGFRSKNTPSRPTKGVPPDPMVTLLKRCDGFLYGKQNFLAFSLALR